MKVLDGKNLSNIIKVEIKEVVDKRLSLGMKQPHLAAILVGNDGASLTYVGSKVRSCKQVGFVSTLIQLKDSVTEKDLLLEIKKLNEDKSVDGYIVQLPLPKHINLL